MDNIVAIASCTAENWSPTIGDPTIWGWITVVIYALAAIISARTMQLAAFPAESATRERVFWALLALGLAFLAINKQLDLQTLLTTAGRCAAQIQGWYDARRSLQAGLIIGLLVFVVLGGVFFLILLRGTLRRSAVPLLGAMFVCGFVLVRAVGMHQVDAMIGMRLPAAFGSVKVNFLLEAPGPLIIMGWGLWLSRRNRRLQTNEG